MYHQKLVLSPCISCILLLVSSVQGSSSNQPTYLPSIYHCIFFFHSVFILMKPFTVLVRDGCHISREKNPSGIAGNGVSTTCCTPRQGTRKAGPPQFLRSFLIFVFTKIAAHFFKRVPDTSLRSIQFIFGVGAWKSCFT